MYVSADRQIKRRFLFCIAPYFIIEKNKINCSIAVYFTMQASCTKKYFSIVSHFHAQIVVLYSSNHSSQGSPH